MGYRFVVPESIEQDLSEITMSLCLTGTFERSTGGQEDVYFLPFLIGAISFSLVGEYGGMQRFEWAYFDIGIDVVWRIFSGEKYPE